MGPALGLIAALFLGTVVAAVTGIRFVIFLVTTKAGWCTILIMVIAGAWYMATHEPPWKAHMEDPSYEHVLDDDPRNNRTPAPTP